MPSWGVSSTILGSMEDHPHLVGCGPGEQRHQHRVDEAGFAGTRRSGHQQMRHLCEVRRDEVTLDVLAEPDDQRVVIAAVDSAVSTSARRTISRSVFGTSMPTADLRMGASIRTLSVATA